MQVVFKNIDDSEMVREGVAERFERWAERFPTLAGHKVVATLEMENSRHKPGPDLFTVKVSITGQRYRRINVEKSGATLHAAVAAVDESMLEVLNRAGDRERVKERRQARRGQLVLEGAA